MIAILFFSVLGITANAQLVPITINQLSFNQDIVAEGPGNDPTASTSIPIGYNYVLYDESFKASNPIITAGGLPANGLITNSLDTWQLKPYTANNALFFPQQEANSSASLVLGTPAEYSKISLLTTSANGPAVVRISLTFSDETSTDFGLFTVKNWLVETPFVIQGFGGIVRNSPVAAQEGPPSDPRLYQLDLNLNSADQLKNVVSIDIIDTDNTGAATVAFFAASGIPLSTLPITFSSLSAQYQSLEKKVVLNWQAETGLNSSGFEVERSINGSVFNSIATVNPNKIMGTSNYSYVDYDLQNKQAWFYRIRETLPGGTINYSKITNVKISAAAFKIIQSGGNIHLEIASPEKLFTYKIVDLQGSELKSGILSSSNKFSIDISSLPAGAYVISVLSNSETKSLKFMK